MAPSNLIALAWCSSDASRAIAQVAAETSSVTWRPATPVQGSLVVVVVRPGAGDSVVAVRGEVAGEPLHFEGSAGWHRALAAVPLAADRRAAIRVEVERARGTVEVLTPSLSVQPRRGRRETLRTAPRFVQPPESLGARIQAEQELILEIKRRAHQTPRLWRGRFARPIRGATTSGFGTARVFNGMVQSRHYGVDFAGRIGAPVRAANRGVVVVAGELFYSGNAVYVDHGAGLITAYLHLSRTLVAVGDTVRKGQVIGRVGASGRVTGPHLHWLAAYGTVSVNPLDLLTFDLPAPSCALPC